MLLLPRTIQALACCAGACLQSFCTWGFFNRRNWGFFNRRKLGNIQSALTSFTQGISRVTRKRNWTADTKVLID